MRRFLEDDDNDEDDEDDGGKKSVNCNDEQEKEK